MDARMIAHDMRTPLNALTLSLQSAKMMRSDPAMLAEALDVAEKNARALARIVETFLETSRGPQTRASLRLGEARAVDLVASAIDQVAPQAAAKFQRIEQVIIPHLPPLFVDDERIIRVMVNLLSNAVKFTPEHGRIQIEARSRVNDGHPAIVFSVSDNGIGVPESDVDRIFVEGVSISRSGNHSSGLGLTVCREIVEAHGGRIWVESGHVKGATFSFALPLNRAEIPDAPVEAVPAAE